MLSLISRLISYFNPFKIIENDENQDGISSSDLNISVDKPNDFIFIEKTNITSDKIKINDGKPFSIISSGLSNIINSKQFQETNISINQIHGLSAMEFVYKDNKVLNIIHDEIKSFQI